MKIVKYYCDLCRTECGYGTKNKLITISGKSGEGNGFIFTKEVCDNCELKFKDCLRIFSQGPETDF